MEYVKLGSTGLDVSRICLGCMGCGDPSRWSHSWVLNEADSRPQGGAWYDNRGSEQAV